MSVTVTRSPAPRVGADHCPGVLSLHEAADGPLARVRLPGGLVSAETLAGIGHLASRCAAGTVDLTARGNVQLRSVRDAAGLTAGLDGLGLLPSAAHDRARNFAVSPLTGLGLGGDVDAVPVLTVLDALVTADPSLAELPGRFLISVDDGSRTAPGADLTLAWVGGWRLLLDGHDCGPATPAGILDAARAFLSLREGDTTCWRVRDLAGGAAALAENLGRTLGDTVATDTRRLDPGGRQGRLPVIVAVAWLQRLHSDQITALTNATAPDELLRLASAGRIVVPARSSDALAVAGLAEAGLAEAGLIVDVADRRKHLTACSGLGACARATVDVRSLAETTVTDAPTHLVACPRGCGRPDDALLELA